MNKQELIERIDKLPYSEGPIADTVTVNREWILKSIEQLDEPNKPVVPQFVADWYEEHKDDFETKLFWCISLLPDDCSSSDLSDFDNWLVNDNTEPFQTLVNMHQFGYEVDKEKRYLVKVIGIGKFYECLNFDTTKREWKFFNCENTNTYRTHHTRKELEEAGFGEVFDSPLFEVEEVEE